MEDAGTGEHDEQELRRLQYNAEHDPLTALWNALGFERELRQHVLHAERYGRTGALLLLDVEFDPSVAADRVSHGRAVKAVAAALATRLRKTDLLGHVEEETFAVFLPHSDEERTRLVAESLVSTLEAMPSTPPTITVGASLVARSPVDPEQLLANAHEALLRARTGDERIVVLG